MRALRGAAAVYPTVDPDGVPDGLSLDERSECLNVLVRPWWRGDEYPGCGAASHRLRRARRCDRRRP